MAKVLPPLQTLSFFSPHRAPSIDSCEIAISALALRPTQRRRDERVVPTLVTDLPRCVVEHHIMVSRVVKPLTMPGDNSVKLECFADVVLSICSVLVTCKAFRDAISEYTWTRAAAWNKVSIEAVWSLNRRDHREHRFFENWITAKRLADAQRAFRMRLPPRPLHPPCAAASSLLGAASRLPPPSLPSLLRSLLSPAGPSYESLPSCLTRPACAGHPSVLPMVGWRVPLRAFLAKAAHYISNNNNILMRCNRCSVSRVRLRMTHWAR